MTFRFILRRFGGSNLLSKIGQTVICDFSKALVSVSHRLAGIYVVR